MLPDISSKPRVERADAVATLMDDAIDVPVVGRVGLDAIVGVLPVAGDGVTALMGLYIVWQGVRVGVPLHALLLMVFLLAVDFFVGSIPLIGDLIDTRLRAHRWNASLVERYA